MKLQIDLTGSEDPVDDLAMILGCYQSLESITEADARVYSDQLQHSSVLLGVLNEIHRQMLDQIVEQHRQRRRAA